MNERNCKIYRLTTRSPATFEPGLMVRIPPLIVPTNQSRAPKSLVSAIRPMDLFYHEPGLRAAGPGFDRRWPPRS